VPLTAGTPTVGTIGRHSITATATEATGGTAPYAHQWQFQWPRGSSSWINATGPGTTTLSATITNLGPSATYNIRLVYTDSASAVVFSNTITQNTRSLPWFPGLTVHRPDSGSN
jgi:hypothetical protein